MSQPQPFPWAALTAFALALLASSLLVGGVYVLVGLGWAMLCAAVPCVILAAIIMRGLD